MDRPADLLVGDGNQPVSVPKPVGMDRARREPDEPPISVMCIGVKKSFSAPASAASLRRPSWLPSAVSQTRRAASAKLACSTASTGGLVRAAMCRTGACQPRTTTRSARLPSW